uniref:Putative secreted protein n=1 Tax=Anopheles triannulatus TaxID=58253 RepID=A0A2M4B7Q1_9DIPT
MRSGVVGGVLVLVSGVEANFSQIWTLSKTDRNCTKHTRSFEASGASIKSSYFNHAMCLDEQTRKGT